MNIKPRIQALSEILVETGLKPTQRAANAAIKKGVVYVEGIRVANVEALLVIVHSTHIKCEDEEITLV